MHEYYRSEQNTEVFLTFEKLLWPIAAVSIVILFAVCCLLVSVLFLSTTKEENYFSEFLTMSDINQTEQPQMMAGSWLEI